MNRQEAAAILKDNLYGFVEEWNTAMGYNDQ